MSLMSKKILFASFFISLFVFFCGSFLLPERSEAVVETYNYVTLDKWYAATHENCNDPTNTEALNCGEIWGDWTLKNSFFNTADAIVPLKCDPNDPQKCKDRINNSSMGFFTKSIASMYMNPPASGVYYAHRMIESAGFAEPAYAQGIGYTGLSPLLPIWRAFRNLSYVILVVFLVVIGFMIMFRMQVNAQTAITIQSALPNIIITLILITFSYAIAGLMIDLMYFVIMLLISILGKAGLGMVDGDIPQLQSWYLNSNVGSLFADVWYEDTIRAFPQAIWGPGIGGLFTGIGQDWTDGLPWWAAAKSVGLLVSVPSFLITGAVSAVLIAFSLLFAFVQIFFILLNSYIQIILGVILSPLQLLMGAIPGRNAFGSWLMGLVGNLVVFPVTIGLFLIEDSIAALTFAEARGDISNADLWSAPLIAGPSADAATVLGIINFGIIMLTPTILRSAKAAFAPQPILPISPGLLFKPIAGSIQTATGVLQTASYVP